MSHRIELYRRALAAVHREENAELWAALHNNMAISLRESPKGSRAENLDQAIAHFEHALTVYTRETNPAGWASTHNNLAAVYCDRLRGERAENLEQAIAHAQQALTVRTRETNPLGWATTQHNLAMAYGDRLCGERAENLEQAIAHYQQALTVRTPETDPAGWASTHNNLANVYRDRLRGERAENLEQAIAHAQQALTVYTREADPAGWAMIQNNLAAAYRNRPCGERAENLEQAIAHAQQALTVYTCEADPERWAMIQHNLANAYCDRLCGERVENLEQAIAHYRQALEVRTLQQFPVHFLQTQRNLGHLHFRECAWAAALAAYQEAIRGGQVLLGGAYTEVGRQAEVAQTAELYARAAYALLKVGRAGEALAQLEQGKTRLLSYALALNEIDVNLLPRREQNTLRSVRQTLRALETEMRLPADTPAGRDSRALADALAQARAHLNDAIACVREEHPELMPEGLELAEILALIPERHALVAPVVTSQGSAVFVVPSGRQSVSSDDVLWVDNFREGDLQTLLQGSAKEARWGGWLGAYFDSHTNATAWFDAIDSVGKDLWTRLMAPIAKRLSTLKVSQVLLLPHGGLGLLPLHAAWHEVNGTRRYFLDDHCATYLPSAYAHKVSLERMQDSQRRERSLLALINPTEDLPFTPPEGEQVASLFDSNKAKVFSGPDATAKAVKEQGCAGYVHFSCHGFYQWDDPMQSGLILANGEPLTLAHIIGELNLGKTRLVTLSACETGITDIRQSPDEYLGLPAGFLQAGAPAVVSTLWAVNDLSTMLLMERFYNLHLSQKVEIPEALRQAQIWLRDVTVGELAQRFAGEEEALLSSTRMSIKDASDYFTRFTKLDSKERPFAHPYYWAAFTFSGA